MFRRAGIMVLVAVAAAVAETPSEALEKLQGAWKTEKLEYGGEPAPAAVTEKLVITIKGSRIVGSDNPNDTATLEMDPSMSPKHILLTEKNGKKQMGIYKIEGEILTMCFADEGLARPTEFKSPKDSKIALIVLKRKKE